MVLDAWLVGQEDSADGYKIAVRDDAKQFGLASVGFAVDKHLVFSRLVWQSAVSFLAM